MSIGKFFIFFIGTSQNPQLTLHKSTVQIDCRISLMVILKLLVRNRSVITDAYVFSLINTVHRTAVNHRFQPHLCKVLNGFANNPFKSQNIADIDRFLFGQILVSQYESHTVSFGID